MSSADMIAALLPETVACAEVLGGELAEELFPEELTAIAGAASGRRQSFASARTCARRALAELGVGPVAIPVGERGEPRWPSGIVGSITHCDGYRAAVVGRARDVVALGIDAESHAPIAGGVVERIALEQELASVEQLSLVAPEMPWGLLLFSAKESVFKACWPLLGKELGFRQMRIEFDVARGTFSVRVSVGEPMAVNPGVGGEADGLRGRWLVRDGLVLTAAVLAAPDGQALRASGRLST